MSDELPKGWLATTLSEITEINPRHPKGLDDSMFVSFAPMAAISQSQPEFHQIVERPLAEIRKGFTHFAEGDVLFAKITPCMENGKGAVATGLRNGLGCGTTELHVVRPLGSIDPHYIYRFLAQASVRRAAREQFTGTAGQARVPTSFLEKLEIPLPPLLEQRRIVAKLEALLGKVDACQKRLAKIPVLLKRFRQSVLAAACSGRLTADWRAENEDIEAPSVLLERILTERKRRFEAATKVDARHGKALPNLPNNLTREEIGIDGLPEIPASWEWVTWNDLADWITYGFTRPIPHVAEGIPIITAKNVRDGFLDFSQPECTTTEAFAELSEKDKPRRNEILITKDGAIRGRASLVETDEPFCISQAV